METTTRSDDRRQAKALAALQATPALREVSQRLLLRLLALGIGQTLVDGEALCREREPADAFFVVLEGRLSVMRDNEHIAPIQPGGSFGIEATLSGSVFPATAWSMGETKVLRFPRAALIQLLDDSAALRQAIRPLTPVALDEVDTAEVVQLRSAIVDVPLSDLTSLLARQIVTDFGEHVLILHPGETVSLPRLGPDGLFHATVTPGALRHHAPFFDYLFLDGFGEDLPAIEGRGDFTAVTLVRGTPPATQGGFPTHLYTVLVDERSPPPRSGLDGFPADGPPPAHRHAPCWVKLKLDALRGRAAERGDDGIDTTTKESLARWARALTQRRVGLTLSGGGAWGFIHIVLLEGLHKRGVPIDVVTSASIGTLVGAFFCTGGIDGARKLLDLAVSGDLDRAAFTSIWNSNALRLFVEKHQGEHFLENMVTRFHPVTTDLNSAVGIALDEGPLGLAVRASCSAPGVWQPTVLGARHFVDGCITHNTPSSILPSLGAHLVFASNCYPAAQRVLGEVEQVVGWAAWAMSGAQRMFGRSAPVSRVLDLMCAGDLMLHSSGQLEAHGADVLYSERPGVSPLAGASRFSAARQMIEDMSVPSVAARVDAMNAKVDEFAEKWLKLKGRSQLRAPISLRSSRLAR